MAQENWNVIEFVCVSFVFMGTRMEVVEAYLCWVIIIGSIKVVRGEGIL